MDFESCREEEEEAGRAAAWHWVWRHICRERPDTGKRLNLLVSARRRGEERQGRTAPHNNTFG